MLVGQWVALVEPKVSKPFIDMTRQPGLEPSSLEGLSTSTWEASEGGALKNLAAWTLEKVEKGRATT